ncbi:MAG: ATP-binding protein, partial [Isosphaeraceae bacterium]
AKTVQQMFKLVENREFGQTLNLETVELEPLVREVIEELTPYLEARKQRVEVEIEPQFGSIDADSSKIMDILINLLANAIKFTPDSGTIRVQAQSLEGNPEWVRVVIKDEGVGVPQRAAIPV